MDHVNVSAIHVRSFLDVRLYNGTQELENIVQLQFVLEEEPSKTERTYMLSPVSNIEGKRIRALKIVGDIHDPRLSDANVHLICFDPHNMPEILESKARRAEGPPPFLVLELAKPLTLSVPPRPTGLA